MRFSLLGKSCMVGVAWIMGIGAASAEGQVVAMASQQVAADIQSDRRQVGRTVDLHLKGVPLIVAIQEISARAGIRIAYADEVVQNAPRVSLQVSGVSAQAALEQLLRGTSLRVARYGGQLAVESAQKASSVMQGTIVGKVIHAKTKQPIAGATVTSSDASRSITTGKDGSFRMQVEAGDRQVIVRALGMVQQQKVVAVPEDGTVSVEFVLEPSASILDQVVVTGTVIATERKAIPNPITVITAEEIERRGITRVDQLLRGEVPGVIALERGSHQYATSSISVNAGSADDLGRMERAEVYARGSSTLTDNPNSSNSAGGANPLKTYVDGVELLDPSLLGTIDPQTIERIEIVTGPQAATVYGSGAMGGVMQIFTKKGHGNDATDVTVDLGYGILENNFNSGRTPTHNDRLRVTGGTGPGFSYSANASYVYQGQWIAGLWTQRMGGSLGLTHTRERATLGGAVSITAGKNGTTSAAIGGSPRWLEKMRSGERQLPVSGYARFMSNSVATSVNQNSSVNLDFRASPLWGHRLVLGRSQVTNRQIPPEPSFAQAGRGNDTLYFSKRAYGSRSTVAYDMTVQPPSMGWLSSTAIFGANGVWGDRVGLSGCLADKTKTTHIDCGGAFASQSGVGVVGMLDDRSWGGFGTVRVGAWDRLFLSFGLRGEVNANYGKEHKVDWTPTNGIAYTVSFNNTTIKLHGSYGRATRPPKAQWREEVVSFSSIYDPPFRTTQYENANLRPEVAYGPQGGFEIYYGNRASITVNRYVQKVDELIQRIRVDSLHVVFLGRGTYTAIYQYVNTASIRQHGWETTGSLSLGPLQLKGTYTWMDSRIRSISDRRFGSDDIYAGMTFLNLPTHTGNLTASYADGATSVTLVTNFVGSSNRSMNEFSDEFTALRLMTYSSRAIRLSGQRTYQGYAKSDLAVSHRVSDSFNLLMNVVNLGNSFGSDFSTIWPTVGRQTSLGAQYRFRM